MAVGCGKVNVAGLHNWPKFYSLPNFYGYKLQFGIMLKVLWDGESLAIKGFITQQALLVRFVDIQNVHSCYVCVMLNLRGHWTYRINLSRISLSDFHCTPQCDAQMLSVRWKQVRLRRSRILWLLFGVYVISKTVFDIHMRHLH